MIKQRIIGIFAIAIVSACTQPAGLGRSGDLIMPPPKTPDVFSKLPTDSGAQRPLREHEIPWFEPWVVTAGGSFTAAGGSR